MNLLFHQAALGDFVLTFPLLRAMAEPTTVVAPWSKASLAGRLFEHVTPMDIELWEFTRLHAAGGPTSVSPAVGDLFAGADRIISFISSRADPWAGNVARLAPGAAVAHVQPRPPTDWSKHVTQWHREQLAKQGLKLAGDAETAELQSLSWGMQDSRPATRVRQGGTVVVHPGSGGREKCWPRERFEAVMAALRGAGREVVAVLGEAEVERWPGDDVERWRTRYDARLPESLEELHDLLVSAAGFIGNDAGPTHLAAQLGLATVALFGPTNPAVWAPVGPRVTVLAPQTPSAMEWLKVNDVLAACGAAR